MRSKAIAVLLTSAVACGVACGGDAETTSTPPATPRVRDLATSMCGLFFRCCVRGELNLLIGPYVDADNCADRLINSTALNPGDFSNLADIGGIPGVPEDTLGVIRRVPNLAALERATSDRRGGLDRQAVEACVGYLDELPCNQAEAEQEEEGCTPPAPPPEPTPCDLQKLFIGEIEEGGECSSAPQGPEGTPESEAGAGDAGAPEAGAGDAGAAEAGAGDVGAALDRVEVSLECEPGLVCRSTPGYGTFGECVKPGEVDDFCFSDIECGKGLYCSLLYGTCQEFRKEGEACAFSDRETIPPDPRTELIRCEEDLFCDYVTDRCVVKCQRGALCVSDEDCDELQGLICIQSRCDFPRAEGLPCGEDEDCVGGLRCGPDPYDPNETACVPRLENGERCDRDGECISTFCHPLTDRCTPPVLPGESCPTGLDEECRQGYCDSDTCAALRAEGDGCSQDRQCETEACAGGSCRVLPLANGELCDLDEHCESEFCNTGEDEPSCAELPLPVGTPCDPLDPRSPKQCESWVCFDIDQVGEDVCTNGLEEGDECDDSTQPPCDPKRFYCNRWEHSPAICVPLRETGEDCDPNVLVQPDIAVQCRSGVCEPRFGRYLCTAEPPADKALCDGE